jgi:ABC-type glutathione transport system ATPase component
LVVDSIAEPLRIRGGLSRSQVLDAVSTSEIVRRPQHPHTRLLVGSAPTLSGTPLDRQQRRAPREELERYELSANAAM